MSVPAGFARLTGRVLRMDETVLAGARVSLRASVQRIVAVGGAQRPVYVGDDIECALDESGFLLGPDGKPGVLVLASDGPYSPSGFTWRIQVTAPSIPTQRWSVFAASGETVDLGAAVPVPPDTGQAVIEWQAVRDEVLVARDVVADAVVAVDQDRAWAMAARAGAEQAANRAEVAASGAGSSADVALGHAGVAQIHAEVAAASAGEATEAKTGAEAACAGAQAAAGTAGEHASAAAGSAQAAGIFVGEAQTAAGSAAGSAQAAGIFVGEAQTAAGSAAGSASAAAGHATAAGQREAAAGVSAQSAATHAANAALSASAVASPAGQVTWAGAVTLQDAPGFLHALLTGNVDLTLPPGPAEAIIVHLLVKQDSVGTRTLRVINAATSFGTAIALTAAPHATDLVSLLWTGGSNGMWVAVSGAQNLLIPTTWII